MHLTVPSAPGMPQFVNKTATSLGIQFLLPLNNNGMPLTGFEISAYDSQKKFIKYITYRLHLALHSMVYTVHVVYYANLPRFHSMHRMTPLAWSCLSSPVSCAAEIAPFNASGYTNGTALYFRVAATNFVGTGPQSAFSALMKTSNGMLAV